MGAGKLFDERPLIALGRTVLGSQSGKRFDDFAHTLRQINERWDNRFIPERESLAKAYQDGRFEIVLHLKLGGVVPSEDLCCLLHIEKDVSPPKNSVFVRENDQASDGSSVRRYDQLVMLVDPVQSMETIEAACPALIGLHFIENKPCRTGDGLLYRVESGGLRYVTWPVFAEGKHSVIHRQRIAYDGSKGMVESRLEVVNYIPDDQRQRVWEWLDGAYEKFGSPLRIRIRPDVIELFGLVGCDDGIELIDMAIGPLNL
jgi:hypothetical protein